MRLPRFRFTIGRFMVILSVATILIVVVGAPALTWFRLREGYLNGAEDHEEKGEVERQTLANLASLRSWGLDKDPLFPICEDLARRRLAFHAEMGRKWRKAAANPWADASPDPDEPTDDRIVKKFDLPMAKYMTDDVQYFSPPIGSESPVGPRPEKD